MRMLLIIDANLGQTRAHTAETLLSVAARKAKLEVIDDPNDTKMATILGDFVLNDGALNGKSIWLGDTFRAVTHPELLLSKAKDRTKPYTAPVATIASVAASGPKRVAAVTACPTGVAHTFMAAEAIGTEAKKRDWWVRVGTRGSVGTGNAIAPKEVAVADLVIAAVDIEVDPAESTGKLTCYTSTGLALKKTAQELDRAATEAMPYEPAGRTQTATTEGKRESTGAYCHLLTGAPCMLPIVIAGSLCITPSFASGIEAFKESGTSAAALVQIDGDLVSALTVPALADYIIFSIADRSSLTPGLIGGMLAVSTDSDLIGDIIAGSLTGYTTKLISTRLKLPWSMEALRSILIIPLIFSLVVGLTTTYLISRLVADILDGLTHWLQTMGTVNTVLLGAILGGMMCTNMGGPVNKMAYVLGMGLLSVQTYGPMTTIMAAGMVPPLAMDLAAMVAHHKLDKAQQEGSKAVLVLSLCFISGGAIPSAARDPIYVLSYRITSGALTSAISMAIGAKLIAPHGGLFILLTPGVITPVLGYLVAIIAGTLVVGLAYAFLKRPET